MAITSPALAMSIEALFGAVKPATDTLQKLGAIDFTKDAPGIDIKPGATIKVPLSSVTAASAFNPSSNAGGNAVNNYLTGGSTSYGTLAATHYLQGFDVSGIDIDQGVNAARIKNVFAKRAGMGIALACMTAVKTLLNDGNKVTTSTGVTLTATTANSGAGATVADYLNIGSSVTWLDKTTSVLAVNGATLADIKSKFAAVNVVPASLTELAQYLGYRDMVLIPGLTPRCCIVPAGTFGSIARVPAVFAQYKETGVETDEESGLSIGIVVANDQGDNRQVVNADLWFGCIAASANAGATTSGIIKIT